MDTRILLTGANGQLGQHIAPLLSPLGDVVATARAGADRDCDLADPDSLNKLLDSVDPDVIVNTAAWTAVDGAESDRESAFRLNRDVPGRLADWCRRHGALLVHYSTDYVFGGDNERPWREDDTVAPLNVYGASKRAGEEAILETGCRALILRTSWVYSLLPGNFLSAILARAKRGEPLQVVGDQTGSPTWAGTLAEATVRALSKGGETGLYHVSCRGAYTWHEFAVLAVELAAEQGLIPTNVPVEKIDSTQWPQAAKRPAWSVMAGGEFERTFDYQLPGVAEALRQCVEGSRFEEKT